MDDRHGAKRSKRGGVKRFGLSGAERQQGQRGITAAGPVRQGKKGRQGVTYRQSLRAGEVKEEGTPAKKEEEEEGVDEGEFECVRQTWTEAIVSSWSWSTDGGEEE